MKKLREYIRNDDGVNRRVGVYECSCGNEFEAHVWNVASGRVKGCGCRRGGYRKKFHESGYIGVSRGYFKGDNTLMWRSGLTVGGKSFYLGSYDSAREAAVVRDNKVKELGLDYKLNF